MTNARVPRILVIDDDPHLLTILSKLLSRNNFDVILAENGTIGLEKAQALRPDLIVLDIIMPGMDGFQVAERLQNDPNCAGIPIMVLTAYASPYGRKAAIEAGVDDFVTKPFGLQELLERIKSMIATPDSGVNDPTLPLESVRRARLISVHSLYGSTGCTALAVNLAVALEKKWRLPTLLLDGDYERGQVADALGAAEDVTWIDLAEADELQSALQPLADDEAAQERGLNAVALPGDLAGATQPGRPSVLGRVLQLKQRYEYIVADLTHEFEGNTYEVLASSEKILYVFSPQPRSLKLAKEALALYTVRGIDMDKVELIMVDEVPGDPARVSDMEQILGHAVSARLPYAAEMPDALEWGLPFVQLFPNHPYSDRVGRLAELLSKPGHRQKGRRKGGGTHVNGNGPGRAAGGSDRHPGGEW